MNALSQSAAVRNHGNVVRSCERSDAANLRKSAAPVDVRLQNVRDLVSDRPLEGDMGVPVLACRQGLVDVEFVFVEFGSLRRRRKLLRLVDERGMPQPESAAPVIAGAGR